MIENDRKRKKNNYMSRTSYSNQGSEKLKKYWNSTETAKNYVNIASVLAGFAFTAVVLVVQSTIPMPNNTLLRDWSSIAFLIGFFGCVVSSFTFSVIVGEEEIFPRSFALMLLAGGGFAISGIYLFWGLAILIKLFLTADIASVSKWIFGGSLILIPMYLISSAADILIANKLYNNRQETISKKKYFYLFIAGYFPILVGIFFQFILSRQPVSSFSPIFNLSIIFSLALIILGNAIAFWVSHKNDSFRLDFIPILFWIFLHSCIFGLLTILLQ
ncbi:MULTISPECIES: hypothetical protein [Okeania]|uniref:Uncharacterized protein n=1 Tax=Okeania hirsuta TaxID=1458930 RepID=A0A3N6PP08_9CYAN|nr:MULTISPECIES: hypothetical protein [Okeania]NES88373.1 hypothetical protein [Okeania sp. SIO2B9]NET78776.1 hypothetical protein [Okeania sp. SIO1F9]RQH10669.1 hypothetical protein D4Z78_27740 [Okeania hirsuta]RQH33747.1 hypothetical protein D5R40_21280 [Okeania hirsuta]